MRIVGGELRGRTFAPPTSITTRPMMDRVREALFNVLAHRDWGKGIGELFDEENRELRVLDAFCGTGALAFEAISRGAAQATLFDKDAEALKVARQNASSLTISEKCSIFAADSTNPPLAPTPCQLIFLAPPYRKGLIPPAFEALNRAGWIAPHAVIVAETAKTEKLESLIGFTLIVARAYGEPMLHFLTR
jgi:16S rRNA (guanine966-N2)-methyltransferase